MTTCRACGATWAGLRLEHCTVCHQTFTGTEAGDRHRIGSFTDPTDPRRCMTPEEMRAHKMAPNDSGYWQRVRPARAPSPQWVNPPPDDGQHIPRTLARPDGTVQP